MLNLSASCEASVKTSDGTAFSSLAHPRPRPRSNTTTAAPGRGRSLQLGAVWRRLRLRSDVPLRCNWCNRSLGSGELAHRRSRRTGRLVGRCAPPVVHAPWMVIVTKRLPPSSRVVNRPSSSSWAIVGQIAPGLGCQASPARSLLLASSGNHAIARLRAREEWPSEPRPAGTPTAAASWTAPA